MASMPRPQLLRTSQPTTSLSMSDLRSRTPIVENIISLLPSGHDKALKYAFYNVIALVLAGASILALGGVYCILEPFIKSLLWALLCGSVLYPFKRKLVAFAQGWMEGVKGSQVPFVLQLLATPVIVADSVSDRIGDYVTTYWKWIGGGIALFFGTYVLYYNPPRTLGLILKWIVTTVVAVLEYVLGCVRSEIVMALIVAYVGLIFHTMIVRYRKQGGVATNDTKIEEKVVPDAPEETVGLTEERTQDVTEKDSVVSRPLTIQPSFGLGEVSEMELLLLKTLSVLTWTMTFLFLCRNLPYTVLIPFLICMVAGTVAYFRKKTKESSYAIPHISMLATKLVLGIGQGQGTPKLSRSYSVDPSPFTSATSKSRGLLRDAVLTYNIQTSASKEGKDKLDKPSTRPSSVSSINDDVSEDEVDYAFIDSNKFLYGVFLACLVVQVWHHLWLTRLLPIPVLYYGIKKVCFKIGLVEFFQTKVRDPVAAFYTNEKDELSENIFPPPVRILLRIMSIADRKLCEFCEAYLDPVVSTLILVLVLIITVLFFVFAATQVYLEGDHLVRVSIDLINTTVSQHPEISEILPEGWETMMGSAVDNAYLYGKEYITNTIRDSIEEKDPEKAREIEKQVIDLWDKVYHSLNQTWGGTVNDSDKMEIDVRDGGSGIEWNELLETGKSVPKLLEYSVFMDYAKANLGTLMSLLESAWNILIGNVSIAMSAIMSVFSVVFGGGSAIVNLMLNFVVFFTALFYLLNSSTTVYKPVEIFRKSIPGDGKHSSRLLSAVEDSVNSVFTASLKMATFYGIWTWLVHSLFQINIVFVPSLLAALLGAVPLVAPYFAALPAVLELFLIQGEWTLAILMMLAQMAPMSMVDTQIYSEIKGGGHPYLTGLAVAGGIFYFGMQGAIIGPVILCCFVVTVKMGSSFLRDEDSPEDTHNAPKLHPKILPLTPVT